MDDDTAKPTKRPPLRYNSPAYNAARDAMIEIIKRWAVAGKTDTYKALSEELDGVGYTVPYFSRLMSVLLESACREEARTGSSAMLTAIVVNKGTRAPSDQFGELAKTSPFHRDREPGWTWKVERDRVFREAGIRTG